MRSVFMALALAGIATPTLAQQGRGLAALQAMDANRDGLITRTEAQAARMRMFDRLDADEDGALDATERAAIETGPMAEAVNGADSDRDGRVSRAEIMALPYRGFDRLDRDHDGVVSTDEIEAVRNSARSR